MVHTWYFMWAHQNVISLQLSKGLHHVIPEGEIEDVEASEVYVEPVVKEEVPHKLLFHMHARRQGASSVLLVQL